MKQRRQMAAPQLESRYSSSTAKRG